MNVDSLRERLESLAAVRRAEDGGGGVENPPSAPRRALREVLGGSEWLVAGNGCWRVDHPYVISPAAGGGGGLAPAEFLIARRDAAPSIIRAAESCIIDIETGGFSGTPVFLIGVLLLDPAAPRIVQLLARDYPEEATILRGLAEIIAGRCVWITFNGKSFDEPFLRDRATAWRVELPAPTMRVDVLHAARRRWRDELPDCRLKTLEEQVLGRSRPADVPSADIPLLFHAFFRSGNAAPLRSVLEHNRTDLETTAELLRRLSDEAAAGPSGAAVESNSSSKSGGGALF